MGNNAFAKEESMLRLSENLIAAEEDRLNGKPGYSVGDVSAMMKKTVQGDVSQHGIPLNRKLLRNEPLYIGDLSEKQFNAEVEKGLADVADRMHLDYGI